jgi:hypothetical protein
VHKRISGMGAIIRILNLSQNFRVLIKDGLVAKKIHSIKTYENPAQTETVHSATQGIHVVLFL